MGGDRGTPPLAPPHKGEGNLARLRTVAVIDTGKTNGKVALVSAADGAEIIRRSAATVVRQDGPYPHFDVAKSWDFICGALAEVSREEKIDAISITAHGSAGAFIHPAAEDDGLALPILDYEFPGPDELYAEYDAARPDFSESFTPRLPAGLNLGAQIFWQERRFPERIAGARYVNYPQYWAWRLSGVAATEMCSMGAHSDLWNPRALKWSSMVERLDWKRFLAPLRPAFDKLGPLRGELAKRLGLDPQTPVTCGIHDSSASLLPHLKERAPPFTVVSTGTWVILFAVGGDIEKLDPAKDTLANVSALGEPVPCGRFMGGREFEMLTGGAAAQPSDAEIARVLEERIMALPTFVPGTGPFPRGEGRWSVDPRTLSTSERNAAASLYLALMTAESIRAAGGSSPVIVEGPFARNALYCSALAAAGPFAVEPSDSGTGTTLGAALLAIGELPTRRSRAKSVEPLTHAAFAGYAVAWREEAAKE